MQNASIINYLPVIHYHHNDSVTINTSGEVLGQRSISSLAYKQPNYDPHDYHRRSGVRLNTETKCEELISDGISIAWWSEGRFFDRETKKPLNGLAPSADGKENVLYHHGYGVGRVEHEKLYYGNSTLPFTGISASFNGKLSVYYSHGTIDFVVDPDANYLAFSGRGPALKGKGYVIYDKGKEKAAIVDDKVLDMNGVPFNGSLPSESGKSRWVYQNGRVVGYIVGPVLFALNGSPFSGLVPSYDGKSSVLCDKGNVVGQFKNGKLIDENNRPFSGVAPNAPGDSYVFYMRGEVAPLIPECGQLVIEQQSVADCYALALMYGILSSPKHSEKIRKSCSLDVNGNVSITLFPDPTKRPMLNIFTDPFIQKKLSNKGYQFLREGNHTLIITIRKDKLNTILRDETVTSKTNAPFIKIMEHVISNLFDIPDNPNHYTKNIDSPTAHKVRLKEYDDLVANLFNYEIKNQKPLDVFHLAHLLLHYKEKGLCLAEKSDKGFIYIVLEINQTVNGLLHGRHAFLLQGVKTNLFGAVEGGYLVNPWHTDKIEYYSLSDLIAKKIAFEELYSISTSVLEKPMSIKWPNESGLSKDVLSIDRHFTLHQGMK